MIVRVIYADGT
jgi:uncharacterized protein